MKDEGSDAGMRYYIRGEQHANGEEAMFVTMEFKTCLILMIVFCFVCLNSSYKHISILCEVFIL